MSRAPLNLTFMTIAFCAWPLPAGTTPELSGKDARQPTLAAFDSPFPYDGRPLAPLA